jgi:RNA polymerase sigma-70 factor (ECF subfamily)
MEVAAMHHAQRDPTELELATRAARGDTLAFEVIMRRHNRMLYRAARSILKSEAEAEDAVQDAYVRAYQALPGFRGDASLGTWLTRIAVNEALGRLRRHGRESNVIALEEIIGPDGESTTGPTPDQEQDGPEAATMREQVRALLERHIDALPATFRSVFVLRALEEMSVEEVATCLTIPPATVRTRYFRARALLRESLERELDLASSGAFGFAGARCDRIVAAVLTRLAHDQPGAPTG